MTLRWVTLPAIVALSILAGCASPGPGAMVTTAAAQPPACMSPAALIDMAKAEYPDARLIAVTGDEAASLTAGINAVTEAELPAGGTFIVLSAPGVSSVYVVMFVGGCAVRQGEFPAELVARWIKGERA